MASMFLPGDAIAGVQQLIASNLDTVNVGSIGELDLDDNGELIFDPPCARTRLAETQYRDAGDNQHLVYNAVHIIDIWLTAENLASKEAQRDDTLTLMGQVVPLVAGARVPLASDGTVSEPSSLVGITPLQDDPAGTVYVLRLSVPGIAQFQGGN